jgi:hypothetical protein
MTVRYIVCWWMGHAPDSDPYAALFTNKVAAEAAASVRNGLLVTIGPRKVDIVDYYRRDEKGLPMPAEWRDLVMTTRSWGPPKVVPR